MNQRFEKELGADEISDLADDEYPPEGRFAWDFVMDEMTPRELDEMCDYAEIGDLAGAESVIQGAETRLFGVSD